MRDSRESFVNHFRVSISLYVDAWSTRNRKRHETTRVPGKEFSKFTTTCHYMFLSDVCFSCHGILHVGNGSTNSQPQAFSPAEFISEKTLVAMSKVSPPSLGPLGPCSFGPFSQESTTMDEPQRSAPFKVAFAACASSAVLYLDLTNDARWCKSDKGQVDLTAFSQIHT